MVEIGCVGICDLGPIASLKRFAADAAAREGHAWQPEMAPANGRRVAVIGGGPAGLTAAYHLRKRGCEPTILEAADRLGGLLIWGIPEYRLPRDVIEREIAEIVGLGVEVKTNQTWGRDFTLERLRKDGFEAIVLAIGAHKGLALDVEGDGKDALVDGGAFLRRVNEDTAEGLKDRMVAVIGGGDVAIDAARAALRLGAAEVKLVYRRTRADMPAREKEIIWAEEDGVELHTLLAPRRVAGNGTASGLECTRMALSEFDRSGRRRPGPVPDSAELVEADTIIAAIGQTADVPEEANGCLVLSRGGALEADSNSLATSVEGVFGAGDAVSGPATVI